MIDPIVRTSPQKTRLWDILDGDPYSYHLRPSSPEHYRIKLRTIPPDVAGYVTSRIPALTPFDWWWARGSDKTGGWIEVCIRARKVVQIMG